LAIIEHKFTVGLQNVGNYNRLTDKSILGFFEEVAGLHSDKIGYGIRNIEKTHLSWVLLNWKLQIIERPKYGDVIICKTWSRHSEKFYSYRDFEMYSTDGKLLAIATSKWSLIDTNKGLTKITDELISKYEPENKSVFNELEIPKLKEPDSFSMTTTYTVPRYVIDINEHMHNLYYLDVAYEALPYELYKNCNFNNIEIMYKRSAKLGNTLNCYYSKVEDTHFVTIKSFDNKTLHSIIKLN